MKYQIKLFLEELKQIKKEELAKYKVKDLFSDEYPELYKKFYQLDTINNSLIRLFHSKNRWDNLIKNCEKFLSIS